MNSTGIKMIVSLILFAGFGTIAMFLDGFAATRVYEIGKLMFLWFIYLELCEQGGNR